MRCIRCGNDNPEDNRFCGMCGATLLAPTAVPETQTKRAASGTIPSTLPSSKAPTAVTTDRPVAAARPVETPRSSAPAPTAGPEAHYEPTISGPSFLGLNEPPRRRASLSIDPHSGHSSRSVDYLLDDEEERRGGSAGKIFLILLAFALAAGFGYLRWKHQPLPGFGTSPSKPSPTAEAPSDGDAPPTPAATPAKPKQDAQAPIPVPTTPSATPAQAPTETAKADTPASTADSDSAGTGTAPTKTEAPPKNEVANPTPKKPGTKASTPADGNEDDTADESEPAAPAAKPEAAKPEAARPARIEKPTAGRDASPRPRTPATMPMGDPVNEAQKYLYGRGAAQDCDHGLRVLKPAANQANAKAMIQMGALYSAGLCTPRDLPTAYRWFALALRKDPENVAVQKDLQKLWGEMTQPERQLAIKLTQ